MSFPDVDITGKGALCYLVDIVQITVDIAAKIAFLADKSCVAIKI